MKCFRRCSKMKLFIIAKIVRSRKRNRLLVCSIVLFLVLLMSRLEVRNFTYNCANAQNQLSHIEGFGQVNIDRMDFQNVATPLVWIGGIPKSGSSLVQSMLNLHPGIRCLNESRVLTRVLSMHRALEESEMERNRLNDLDISNQTLDGALASYILAILSSRSSRSASDSSIICTKEPFVIRSSMRLTSILPNSKFIFVVRDARATVSSIINNHLTIKGFDSSSFRSALVDWNRIVTSMHAQCILVGSDRCLIVFYELLLLRPVEMLDRMFAFLRLLVSRDTLDVQTLISLSKKNPNDSLTRWTAHIPDDSRANIRSISPMMQELGYDTDAHPPNYSLMHP